ncbi:MAG: hypothetical protein PSX36_04460 [bacterium]|nr:hypothetical protein [bacterium]
MNSVSLITLGLVFSGSISFGQLNQSSSPRTLRTLWQDEGLPSLDIYGAIPHCAIGGGAGFGVFAKPFTLEQFSPVTKLQLRFGADFYCLQNLHKNLGTVPLVAPQTGDAKVKINQNNYGFNVVARFLISTDNGKLTPYLDVFTGLRGYSSNLIITPIQYQSGYESSSSTNLSSTAHWNYGATIGLMYSLNSWAIINTGIMYATTNQFGEMVNVSTAKVEGGTVITENQSTPKNAIVFKVGFTFLIKKGTGGCSERGSTNYGFGGIISSGGCQSGGALRSNHVSISIRPSK